MKHSNSPTKKGFIFKCSDRSESECFERSVFGADRVAKDEVLQLEKGDALFLLNVNSNRLMGIFEATSDGGRNLIPDAWRGRYPYQVRVKTHNGIGSFGNAKRILDRLGIHSHKFLQDFEVNSLDLLLNANGRFISAAVPSEPRQQLVEEVAEKLRTTRKSKGLLTIDEKPSMESTTLWDYPTQSYGSTPKGNNKYAGVTPAFIIWNMVKRYTDPGDLVLDPMCGSGTTIDVCKEEGRKVIGYDIVSVRPDVIENDARNIPLSDNSVDMVFIDSPYGDNIEYNKNSKSIGNISAESEEFYGELEKVMKECYRVMKPGKVLGWLIGDQWVKKRFTSVGFKIYERLTKYFEPVDVICVARRSQTSNTGLWHNRAIQFNFYLRGFKYLHIVRKPLDGKEIEPAIAMPRTIKWTQYQRGKANYVAWENHCRRTS